MRRHRRTSDSRSAGSLRRMLDAVAGSLDEQLDGEEIAQRARFGFYTFNLDLYVDTDRVPGSGRTETLPGRNLTAAQLTEKVLERSDAVPAFERIPLNKEELAVLDFLRQNPRITLGQYMKLLNIGQRRAYRTLIKLTLHGYIKHHDKEKEVYYTL